MADASAQRSLGQYFTPRPVVELCYRILQALDPSPNPRIIDPSCGEVAFLTYPLEHGLTSADRLFGIEKDESVAESWPVSLNSANLFIGDAIAGSKLKAQGPSLNPEPETLDSSFDWVVGNPPFGTGCLDVSRALIQQRFSIWKGSRRFDPATYPIEILFLEKFLSLARPGGLISVVIPDGILANERLAYVREWILRHSSVRAVVSLPRHVFHLTGAGSKASVLILEKVADSRAPIFMAILNSLADEQICSVSKAFTDFLHSRLADTPNAFSTSVPEPGDRLDPAYYDPVYTENLRFLNGLPNVARLGDFVKFTTYGAVGRRELSDSGVRLITPANLVSEDGLVLGVDVFSPERFVTLGSRNDPARSRLRKGDLLLANSGVGCIGRAAVFYSDEACNISQHLNLIRLKGIEPEYVAVYLQTRFGKLQIEREKCGVGPPGINFHRIKSILIPILPSATRRDFASGYLQHTEDLAKAELTRELVERLEKVFLSQATPRQA